MFIDKLYKQIIQRHTDNNLSLFFLTRKMGLTGVLHVEVEVKSPAEKFWVALGDGINLFPKAFPNDYKTIQVLAGDGNAPGSIRLITYGEGTLILSHSIFNL